MKRDNIFLKIIALFVVFNLAVPSFAQQAEQEGSAEPAQQEAMTPTAADKASEEATMAAAQQAEQGVSLEQVTQPGNVTLIFKDADIRTVLHTLSYKSGVNIVAASDVEGKVNIRLVDVPWETALEVMLKNHNLSYEKVGNIIRVVTHDSVAAEELQSKVFVLNFANAEAVAKAIDAAKTDRGSINFDPRTNTVIVSDIPTNIYKIQEVITRLDKRTPQVRIEARIIETTLDDQENLGIDWTVLAAATGAARPTTFPFKARDASFFTHRPKDGATTYLPNGDDASMFPDVDLPTFPLVGADAFTFGTLDFSQFSAVLELLNTRTDTKILSYPTIITLDNKEAKVNAGEIFNIPTYERNDTTGAMEITGYTEKDLGVILTVTPHVNEAGDIVCDVKPEVSAFKNMQDFGSAGGGGTIQAPIFTNRTAQTQIMLKSGQTIVIGGLVSEQKTKYKNKVPFFGDIPMLGNLFTKTEDGIITKDLLIFVTVYLMKENQSDLALLKATEKKSISGVDKKSDVSF